MSIDLEQFNKIKKHAEDRRREVNQAEGAMTQLLADLKDKFGCENIRDAEEKLAELERQEKEAAAVYEKELAAYKEKWGDLLK